VRDCSGFALLNKAAGLSSFSALNPVKQRISPAKLGHSGTLDPFATGLLVGLAGSYSHLSSVFSGLSKCYTATLNLGIETDTLDPEGQTVARAAPPSRAALEAVLPSFCGDIMQEPPAYSALHVGGRRAYDLARSGQKPVLAPRPVHIYELRLLSFEASTQQDASCASAKLFVRCSSGTYIRSLARDIGLACASRASLSALERSSIGPFSLEEAVAPQDFDPERDLRLMTPALAGELRLGALSLPEALESSFDNGGNIDPAALRSLAVLPQPESQSSAARPALSAVFGAQGQFRGLVEISGKKLCYRFVIRREP